MYISTIIHFTLNGIFTTISDINFKTVINSIFSDEQHLKVYVLLQFLFSLFLAFVTFIQKDNIFQSKLGIVTNTIKTPFVVGQGQHGTARWLKKNEFNKVFHKNILDSSKDIYNQNFTSGGLVVGYNKLKNSTEEIFYIDENTHCITVRCYKEWKNKNNSIANNYYTWTCRGIYYCFRPKI